MNEYLWARVGDAGEYERFDDLGAALDYLNESSVGQVDGWMDHGRAVGFETPNYWGDNCISLYWGDTSANLIRPLDATEQALVENTLEEAYI